MDIAIQEYGNQLGIFEIIADNPAIQFDSNQVDLPLIEGQELQIRKQSDLIKNNNKQELSGKEVTSHVLENVDETENIPYLADELGNAIVDEQGNFILTPN